MSGRIIYSNSAERPAGKTLELVETSGWSSGVYLVTLSANGHSRTTSAVVVGG